MKIICPGCCCYSFSSERRKLTALTLLIGSSPSCHYHYQVGSPPSSQQAGSQGARRQPLGYYGRGRLGKLGLDPHRVEVTCYPYLDFVYAALESQITQIIWRYAMS